MLKKLLIPFVVFTAAAVVGCGSSTPSKTGTGGTGGTATGGTGGTATGGTGGTATGGTGGTATGGTGGTATGGTGGTATGGTGGTATGGTGGTATGGTGGTATGGTDGGSTAGTDGGSDGGGAPNVAALKLECPTKIAAANSATPFTAEEFCALYADACGTMTFTGALTSADCVATYTSWATKKVMGMTTVGVQNCTSYHVCNAESSATAPATHCPHAAATASPMVCTPAN